MKPAQSFLVALAAVSLLGACQSSTKQKGNPYSSSHWNTGFIGESYSESFFGANSYTPNTIRMTNRNASVDMTTTVRRHFFNDNPDNPLQEHRYNPDDRYVPIWHMPKYGVLDLWSATRSGGVNTWNGLVAAVLMPWQLFAGADLNTGVTEPPPPDDFRVKNN
jgi:hypothetical protein